MKFLAFIVMMTLCGLVQAQESGKHLFILSGQSNMARFKPKSWFAPGISETLGPENVIVSFHAKGGQPISKWHKQWKSAKGETDPQAGEIYDAMMQTLKEHTQGQKIKTVTFVCIQGEADSKAKNSDVYLASLNGLKKQLEKDLDRADLNFIIGSPGDSGFYRRRDKKRVEKPHREEIRKPQQAFADSSERAEWIDTDDLNGEKNGFTCANRKATKPRARAIWKRRSSR